MAGKMLDTKRPLIIMAWLVFGLEALIAEDIYFQVPNPFKELTDANVNDFYYIEALQEADEHILEIEEYFSLGLGLTYSVYAERYGKSKPWAILSDGRAGSSYIVHNLDATNEQELDCKLDHVHHHRKHIPWQYGYNSNSIVGEPIAEESEEVDIKDATKTNQQEPLADLDIADATNHSNMRLSIYGIGAIWLNLIRARRVSRLGGPRSSYNIVNEWNWLWNGIWISMTFKNDGRLRYASSISQEELDRSMPDSIKIEGRVLDRNSSANSRTEYVYFHEFKAGLMEHEESRLQRFRLQLELCKRAIKPELGQFPNLIRALAGTRMHTYKIDYVAHRYNSYCEVGSEVELDGSRYNAKHHRFMWPYEQTREVYSHYHHIQSVLYGGYDMDRSGQATKIERQDMFQVHFEENASVRTGVAKRPTTRYYHLVFNQGNLATCTLGERDPKPKYRLLSTPFTFKTERDGIEYKGHVRGLGALLINVAHLHHKSRSLFSLKIQQALNSGPTEVDVWQVIDKREQVRYLFFFEKSNLSLNPSQWDLAERDRRGLARLVRIDVRAVSLGNTKMILDQKTVDSLDGLLVQYLISRFELDPPYGGLENFFKQHELCFAQEAPVSTDFTNSPHTDEDEDPIEGIEGSDYEQVSDDDEGPIDVWSSGLEEEYEQLMDLETDSTPLPDFIELLGIKTSYTMLTRLELLDGSSKAIWFAETMDLLAEQLLIKVYLSQEAVHSETPVEQFVIYYESELVFHITEGDTVCSRIYDIDDNNNYKWMRLFSGHLKYYAAAPSEGMEMKELTIESNRLSSYGLGALWQRVSQDDQAEFLGTRRERVERDGRNYKQLEWLYEEFDMAIEWTFLLEDSSDLEGDSGSDRHKRKPKPQLESVLVTNRYSGQDNKTRTNLKQVRAIVEKYSDGGNAQLTLPDICRDELSRVQRKIAFDQEMKPPSIERCLGKSKHHELEYIVYRSKVSTSDKEEELIEGLGQSSTGGSVGIRFRESFDGDHYRGQIVIGEEDSGTKIELYIDGQSRQAFIMNKQTRKCSLLTEFRDTFNSIFGQMVVTSNPDFNSREMFGVMGLWQTLSKKGAKLHVNQFYDEFGALHEDQVYIIKLELSKGAGESEGYEEIQMYFDKRQARGYFMGDSNFDQSKKTRIRQEHSYKLNRIELRKVLGQMQRLDKENESVRIIIEKQQDCLSEEWKLPPECQQLIGPSDESTPDSSTNFPIESTGFPKLSGQLQRSHHFHLRSQVMIRDQLNSIYLVDELYNGGDVRMRTHGIGEVAEKNCDLLMFADTYSQFDLSVPFRCPEVIKSNEGHCLSMDLLNVWMDGPIHVRRLASVHYGPLVLWRLAERSVAVGMSIKLIKRVDLSSVIWARQDDASLETLKKQLDREMDREVWLVSGTIDGKPTDWSYEMQFVKQMRPLALEEGAFGMEEYHVLESITVHDIDDGDRLSVSIEVVDYNDQPVKEPSRALFQLPSGWGCWRTERVERLMPFRLNVDPTSPDVHLGYEASLELFDAQGGELLVLDDEELGTFRVSQNDGGERHLPTLFGSYLTGYNSEEGTTQENGRSELSVHQSVTRFSNGESLNSRIITDRVRSLEYKFEPMSGRCTITATQDPGWKLNFPIATGHSDTYTISMNSPGGPLLNEQPDYNLIDQIFVQTTNRTGDKQFEFVDKYAIEINGKKAQRSVYEGEFANLKLSKDLEGPARVVRIYDELEDHQNTEPIAQDSYTLVDSMLVQVYLLSRDKPFKLRAILTMRLRVNQSPSLNEFLELASVADCFTEINQIDQPRLARLVLEYPLVGQYTPSHSHSLTPILKENFYINLLRSNGMKLSPLQLDGRAHFEFAERDRSLRVHFNVLEPPSAMVYFSRRLNCTMMKRMESVSESRPLPNLAACSRWCDQVNCLAMSYCGNDRQCRIATKPGIFRSESQTRNDSDVERARDLLANCLFNTDCIYFYRIRPAARQRTLQSFRDHLDRLVNKRANTKNQLEELGLLLGYDYLGPENRVEPTRFYESSDMFHWQHEDYDQLSSRAELSGNGVLSTALSSYTGIEGDPKMSMASYSIWKDRSKFNMEDIIRLNQKGEIAIVNAELAPKHDSKFIISELKATNKANCFEECQRKNCLLVTWCKRDNTCQVISATSSESILSLGALSSRSSIISTQTCAIYIRNYLDMFHIFESTQKPADEYWQYRLDDYTPEECAAACYLNQTECSSFDRCFFLDGNGGMQPAKSVCFMQRGHITQDSFNRSSLVFSAEENTIDGRQVHCDHYSRSVLAEFRRVPNAKVKELHGSTLRGISVDRCAVDCWQDNACQAFEHCQNPKQHPTQSCCLIRSSGGHSLDLTGGLIDKGVPLVTIGSVEMGSKKPIEDQLIISKSCSIYLASDALGQKRLEQTLAIGADDGAYPTSYDAVMICIYLLIATLLGAVLQFAYIRLARQPLTLWPMANRSCEW